MIIKKEVHLYILTDDRNNVCIRALDEHNDPICIGGYDKNFNYQQFEHRSAYFTGAWAEEHGFKLTIKTVTIDVEI